MSTQTTVYDLLKKSGKPMKAGEISTASGIDKKEVEKAIKTLVKEAKIHSPQRCYYQAL